MLIKAADEKNTDIQELESLLKHPGATADIKQRIEREIRNIRSGVKGEKEAAYEIDFHFTSRNWMVIHDLRIEHDGRVAQIDHLLMDRFMNIYVCESKRFGEGVAINEQGEFAMFYQHRPQGIPSPLEQNKKHIAVLESLFKGNVIESPRRLGFKMSFILSGFVLVSKAARITRPKNDLPGVDCVVKTDQFVSKLQAEAEAESAFSMARLIGSDTLEALARKLVALHKPIKFDWAAKFGLKDGGAPIERAPVAPPVAAPAGAPVNPPVPASGASKLVCSECSAGVTYAVAKFCWSNRRFSGKVFCMGCQKNH